MSDTKTLKNELDAVACHARMTADDLTVFNRKFTNALATVDELASDPYQPTPRQIVVSHKHAHRQVELAAWALRHLASVMQHYARSL